MALDHPEAVIAIHINMFLALPPNAEKAPEKFARYQENDYSEQELKNLDRTNWFATAEVSLKRFSGPLFNLAFLMKKLSEPTNAFRKPNV